MNELVVYLLDRRVGRLIRKDNGNLQFRYDHAYGGPPISQVLPVAKAAYPHSVCHAVFGGLLLEGEARETVSRNLGMSSSNEYGLLEALGGDCAGAVTLLEPQASLPINPALRGLSAPALDALLNELPARPLGASPEEGIRMSLAGAQPKLPVILNEHGAMAVPLNAAAPSTHIIKPQPQHSSSTGSSGIATPTARTSPYSTTEPLRAWRRSTIWSAPRSIPSSRRDLR